MIELKVDKFEDGKVTFHIERQDKEDYDRLRSVFSIKLSDGFTYCLNSEGFMDFYPGIHTFCVRGVFKDRDYIRKEVEFSEYLIIYELVKEYNETCFDF